MLALGIDPGTAICGYGFVEAKGSRLIPHAYGSIFTTPDMKMEDRLLKIYGELDAMIKEYQPEVMGVEKLFFNRNVTTAIAVGQARGVIVVLECEHLCMSMRGIKKSSARTVTSAVRGLLRNPATRAEAMSLILDK